MPTLVEVIADRLIKLQQSGLTMLLVETNLDVALKVASRVYVMEKGQIKFNGPKEELIKNIDIQQSYLGVSF
jgi:branched-chain amino acid transport system ATP-binding protein